MLGELPSRPYATTASAREREALYHDWPDAGQRKKVVEKIEMCGIEASIVLTKLEKVRVCDGYLAEHLAVATSPRCN